MIILKTIDNDGIETNTTFNSFSEFQKEWNSEEDNMPYINDKLIHAEIDGKQIQGETFIDVLKYFIINYSLSTAYQSLIVYPDEIEE